MWSSICQAVQFGCAEAGQDGEVALCVFVVDLHHTADEELLLFGCTSLPVVWLGDCHHEAFFASPLSLLVFFLALWLQVHEVVDGGEVLHGPCFANREGAIGVLSRLVQLDAPGVAHRDHDDATLLVGGGRGGRRRRLGIYGVFLDADVGDVGLLQLALVVELGKAALGDAAALVVESLGARHATARAGGGRRASWLTPRRWRWPSTWPSGVAAQAIGVVVARSAVHGSNDAGWLHGSSSSSSSVAGDVQMGVGGQDSCASAAERKRAVP